MSLKKIKIEQIIIVILFLTLFVLFFKYKTLTSFTNKNINNVKFKSNQKLKAMIIADDFFGKNFPIVCLKDIINDKEFRTNFNKPTIIVLFKHGGCKVCLDSEVKLLQQLNTKKLKNETYNMFLIGLNAHRYDLLKIKKTKNIKFPILLDEKDEILKWMKKNISLLILLVDQNQKIIRAHIPMVNDKSLIDNNIAALKRFLIN